MNKVKIFLVLSLSHYLCYCQENDIEEPQKIKLSISAGSHLNFYQWQGILNPPINLQADFLLATRHSLGLGWTYDSYVGDNYFFSTRIRPGYTRHNISIRYLYYLRNPEKIFSVYLGCSAGMSIWDNKTEDFRPTTQFLFGMRLKIYKGIFWMHEFGAGPPFLYQSSLGIRF